jgi:peptidoglycan/LPS O-acetylase OafA/YrhL
MHRNEDAERGRKFWPSLEGIRGYAFLAVFAAHYFYAFLDPSPRLSMLSVAESLLSVAWIAVPIFFVLSGFLIGGILYDTRNREGYFRVFYSRRILRVFPIYYLTLFVIAGIDHFHGISLDYNFWSGFLYIQNLLPGFLNRPHSAPSSQTGHFWSLAVEEQFYLLWPLIVWFCRDRRKLLRVTLFLIGVCTVFRFATPWIQMSPGRAFLATPTRADAILLGVVIVLIRRDAIYARLEPLAKYIALTGMAILITLALVTDDSYPTSYLRVAFLIPCVNVTAAAIVVSVMEENSLLCRICSVRWICWLGSRSYGLYVFHYTYIGWFLTSLGPYLAAHMWPRLAGLITVILGFCTTLLLAVVSYRLIELPAMNLKRRIRYGTAKDPGAPEDSSRLLFDRAGQ